MDPGRRTVVPTDFQSVGCVQATGASCGTAVTGVPQQVRSVAAASVCIPCWPLDGDCRVEGPF